MREVTLAQTDKDSQHPSPGKRMQTLFESDVYLPARKKHISEESVTNDLAAMSLYGDEESRQAMQRHSMPFPISVVEHTGNVVHIDNIDEFLADQPADKIFDHEHVDYNLDTNPILVNKVVNGIRLPLEQRPGENKLRIPDFVLRSHENSNLANAWFDNDYYAIDTSMFQPSEPSQETTEDTMDMDP